MTISRIALAVLAAALLPPAAQAQSKTAAQLEKENKELRTLNTKLDKESRELRALNTKLNKAMADVRKARQTGIGSLRTQLASAQDEALRLAIDFDREKKKLQDEKEVVLRELVQMRRDHALQVARLVSELAAAKAQAKGNKKPNLLTRKVTLNFDGTPLTDVLQFLTDVTGVRHTLAQTDAKLGSVQVSLRLKGITLKNALSLIAASHPKLTWRHDGRGIVFSTKPELVTSPSGLGVVERVVGTGAVATKGKTVTVHYVGTLKDGTVFDSSRAKNKPFRFLLGRNKVIDGWEEGIDGMKVGGKRKLVVPPGLGYGKRAVGKIPPNSTLTFEVELLKVE